MNKNAKLEYCINLNHIMNNIPLSKIHGRGVICGIKRSLDKFVITKSNFWTCVVGHI